MSNVNRFVCALVACACAAGAFAESEGAALFRRNEPARAAEILERGVAEGTAAAEDYNFLGLSYYQLGEYEKSVAAFEAGLLVRGANRRVLAYNAGNSAYAAGDFGKAEEFFSLALEADGNFREALLNRANSKLRMEDLLGALDDYRKFLAISPDDDRGAGRMILLLEAEIKAREESVRTEEEPENPRRNDSEADGWERDEIFEAVPYDVFSEYGEDETATETADGQDSIFEAVPRDVFPEYGEDETATETADGGGQDSIFEIVPRDVFPEYGKDEPENPRQNDSGAAGGQRHEILEIAPYDIFPEYEEDEADQEPADGGGQEDSLTEKIDAQLMLPPEEVL